MKKNSIIILFLFCIVMSASLDLGETRFEKFWKRTFNKMNFREPISFIPYTFKIGYYYYGGDDYWQNWNKILSQDEEYENSPYLLGDASEFPDISNIKYRKGTTFELDILKFNFFSQIQNKVDLLLGVGYKYNKTLKTSYLQDIKLKPNFEDWNINATIIKQWNPKYFIYLYYSYGWTKAKFYESNFGTAKGNGTTQSVGLGLNFITSNNVRKNKMNHGFEIRFENCEINDVADPGIDYIQNFHMRKIGLMYSFSIGDGGTQSSGDEAYLDMLKGDYIQGLEKLQSFQYENPYKYNDSDIQGMIELARLNIPNQLYEEAMNYYYNNNLDKAIKLLYQASYKAEDNLNIEISFKRHMIADDMFDNAEILIQNKTIDEKIYFYDNLKNISNKISNKVNIKNASLLIEKGDLLINNKQYEKGYESYDLAYERDSNKRNIIDIKIEHMITKLLNNVYNLLQNKEHIIAYEQLSFIKDISQNNKNVDALFAIVDKEIENKKLISIRERVKKILAKEKEFVLKFDHNDIFLGDHYEEVIAILGKPNQIIKKDRLDNNYEMLVFNEGDIQYRLFFKNKILIDVER